MWCAVFASACASDAGELRDITSTPDSSQLTVLTQSCDTREQASAVVVTGSVRGSGLQSLAGTQAIALFLATDGATVSEVSAPLYGDLGQTGGIARFTVSTANDPRIERCFVRFVSESGAPLTADYSAVLPVTPPAP